MKQTKVLVVDDDPAITRLCQRILEKHRFEVSIATNGRDALQLAQDTVYDLLITDIRMPTMNGFELASRFRQVCPDSGIILITSFGSVEISIQALRRGVDALLIKPFDSSKELIETVNHVLEKRRYQADAARLRVLRPLFDIIENIYSRVDLNSLKSYLEDLSVRLLQTAEAGVYKFDNTTRQWNLVYGCDLNSMVEPHCINWERVIYHSTDDRLRIVQTRELSDPILRNWLMKNGLEILLVPVIREKAKFILYFLRPDDAGKLHEADLEMAAIFSRQAVIAMENALLYRDLEKMIEEIKEAHRAVLMAEKMSALGRLTGSLAHEMNNPLQAVQNCLHLSLRDDITQEQRREYLSLAVLEVERLSSLAQNTLSFYRASDSIRKRADLLVAVELVNDLVGPQLRANRIELIKSFPPKPVEILMVQDQIQQVILNGLLNAMEALKNQPAPRKIWIEVNDQMPNRVVISIEDNGRGIDPELQEKVFEPFFSTRPNGTGLGLSVSYDLIVNVHQGDIRFVTPMHGSGARLQITLPR